MQMIIALLLLALISFACNRAEKQEAIDSAISGRGTASSIQKQEDRHPAKASPTSGQGADAQMEFDMKRGQEKLKNQ